MTLDVKKGLRPMAITSILLPLLLSACGGSSEQTGTSNDGSTDKMHSLTLGLVVAKTFETTMPARIAQDLGYFADEGLEVEIVAFQGGADLVKGLISGAADIGAATGFDPPAAVAKGVPMKAFAGIAEMSPMVVIAGADSGIQSTEDLCSKKIGITRFGSLTDFVIRGVGQEEKCEITAVPLGAAGEQVAAMTRGETDGFVWSTEVGIDMEATGNGRVVARFADIIDEDQYSVFMAQPDFLAENEETVDAFLRAVYRAIAWMQDDVNRDEAIKKTAEMLELKPAVAEKTFDELVGHLSEDGTMSISGLENLASNLPELEIAPKVPEISEFYVDDFVPVEAKS